MNRRKWLFRGVAILGSTLVALVAIEVGYRALRYQQLRRVYVAELRAAADAALADRDPEGIHTSFAGISRYDALVGHRYRPHLRVAFEAPFGPVEWSTNGHGHFDADDYPVEKPSGEFRVAVIGDSFTANICNRVNWPQLLEDRLAVNDAWRERLDGRSTRVLNLGLDGIGIVQFDKVLEHEGLRFAPDLVLINLITDDIVRRPYYRGLIGTEGRPLSQSEIERHVAEVVLAPLPWWRPYPEALAALVGRAPWLDRLNRLGLGPLTLPPRLDPQQARYYATHDEAMAASLTALRAAQQLHDSLLLLYHPMYEELIGPERPHLVGLRQRLLAEGGEMEFISMTDYLPLSNDPATVARWYLMPLDAHPSDEGLEAYAAAVERLLLERVAPTGRTSARVAERARTTE